MRSDSVALAQQDQVGGAGALEAALRQRMADPVDGDRIYLLLDARGNRLIGNLDQWPKGMNESNTWYQLPVKRQGVASIALLRAYALPDGERLLVGRDVRVRTELRDVLRDGLLWALGLMFALGVIGAFFVRSLFQRMMRDISTTTRAIARGDLTRRISKTGDGDEFDELAEIINDMLERISRLMDGVRQVSNAIAHDLRTPITRARTRLEDATLHAQGRIRAGRSGPHAA